MGLLLPTGDSNRSTVDWCFWTRNTTRAELELWNLCLSRKVSGLREGRDELRCPEDAPGPSHGARDSRAPQKDSHLRGETETRFGDTRRLQRRSSVQRCRMCYDRGEVTRTVSFTPLRGVGLLPLSLLPPRTERSRTDTPRQPIRSTGRTDSAGSLRAEVQDPFVANYFGLGRAREDLYVFVRAAVGGPSRVAGTSVRNLPLRWKC